MSLKMQTPIVATLKTTVENKSKNDSNENPQVTSQQPASIVISVSQSSKKKPTPQQAQHQITLSNAGSTSGSNNGSPRRKFNKMNHNNGPNNSNINNVQQNGGSASTKHHNRNNKRTNNDNNNNSNTKQMNFKTLNHTKNVTQIPNVEIIQKTSPVHVSKSTSTATSAATVTTVPAAGKYRSIVKSQQNITNYEHGDVDGESSTKSSSPAPTSQTSTTEHQLNQQLKTTKSSNNPPTSSFNNPINSPLFTVNSGFNSQDQVDVNRKYSIDFLHFVGYKMTNVSLLPPHPHQQQQAISPGKASKHSHDVETNLAALKVALGDNSGYYNNLYPNTYANYTQNQLILQQQHYQQSFQRNYHHQQQQQQQHQQQHQQQQQQHLHNQRIYSNRHDNYRLYNQHPVIYQTDSEPIQCNCSLNQQQQPPQQPQHQRTYQQNHIHCQQNHQNSYRQVNTKNHHHAHNRDPNRRNRPNSSYMYNNHQQQPHIHNYNGSYSGNKSRNSLHNTSTSSTSSTKSKTVENLSPPVERKNLVYIYSSNSSEHHSLSPTPTSSSKSASPTIDKSSVVRSVEVVDCSYASMDLVDDCDSNSSGSSSTRPLRYEYKQVPTILSAVTYPQASSLSSMTSSSTSTSSTPAIVIPLISSDNDIQKVAKIVEKDLLPAVINDQQNISLWINNSFNLQNAHSVSSDQLNEQNHSKRRQSGRFSPNIYATVPTPATVSANGSFGRKSHSHHGGYQRQHEHFNIPSDRYMARAHEVQIKEAPDCLLTGSPWDGLSEAIWARFMRAQQSEVTYTRKMMLWGQLYMLIKHSYPKWSLYLVGSTLSGFGADTSDIDMCLVSRISSQMDPRMEALVNLNDLKSFLSKTTELFQDFVLIAAKVPILRFKDETNSLEVDLNYNNSVGIRNTHLMYCYSQMDWRLRPLALIVKLWAQHNNINDARNMTISSYSLVLMVIHFLQFAVTPVILPCLHKEYPEKFQTQQEIHNIDMIENLEMGWQSENKQTLGELFMKFLEYYSLFDYAQCAISVRTGALLPVEDCRCVRNYKNDPNHWQTLCIEEPFDFTNTARSVYDGEVFERIKEVFYLSWLRLREKSDLNTLFEIPLFKPIYYPSTPPPVNIHMPPPSMGVLTMGRSHSVPGSTTMGIYQKSQVIKS